MGEGDLTATLVDPEEVDSPVQPWEKGEKQPNRCKDVWAAVLFYTQLIAVLVVAFKFGLPAVDDVKVDDENKNDVDYTGVLYLSLIAGGSAWVLAGISLWVMALFPTLLVQLALLFSVAVSLLVAIGSIISGSIAGAIFGLIFFLMSCCYAYFVWSRIPFAAANLDTGLTAVKTNYGITFVAYYLVAVAFAWTALWTLSLIGVWDQTADCSNGVCENDPNGGYLFLLFLSYFWGEQVIQNMIHVTVAGVVATWWFVPEEASSCCSKSIWDSFVRSSTTSFGSICFGSLLVALVQTLRALVESARREGDDGILLCLLDCCLSCLQGLLEYFNKWAYIYVGMYGYGYLQAGTNVMTLFRQRGWTTIITDDLISNTLTLVCLVIGAFTGCVGLIIEEVQKAWFEEFTDSGSAVAFGIAFVVGLVISSILMSVVDSAVNTVIVCFAEAPAEFQANHPEHSHDMREAWRQVYPAECGF